MNKSRWLCGGHSLGMLNGNCSCLSLAGGSSQVTSWFGKSVVIIRSRVILPPTPSTALHPSPRLPIYLRLLSVSCLKWILKISYSGFYFWSFMFILFVYLHCWIHFFFFPLCLSPIFAFANDGLLVDFQGWLCCCSNYYNWPCEQKCCCWI